MAPYLLRVVSLLWSCILLVPSSTRGDCSNQGKKKIVCYYPNWTYWRQGFGKYSVKDIDAHLCTHVIYAFTILHPATFTLTAYDTYLDLDSGLGNFRKFVALRESNPSLKLVMAIGGWPDSRTHKYSTLLADPSKRHHFVKEVVKFLAHYGFDGLDLDYEYPNYDGRDDRAGFTALVRELRRAFHGRNWELTSVVSASMSVSNAGYDVAELSGLLDAVHLMTYDLHGAWETRVDHHAPLFKREFEDSPALTVDYAVKYWLSHGTPKEKLIVGIPTYGRSFTLSGNDTSPQSPSSGNGLPGSVTREGGQLSYQEICLLIKNSGWTVVQDPTNKMGPYAYKGNQWVGYDDPAMAERKANYILQHKLGGAMFWDLPSDDFNNRCGHGKYPIISKVAETLKNGVNCQSLEDYTIIPTSYYSEATLPVPFPTKSSLRTAKPSLSSLRSSPTVLTNTALGHLCEDPNGIYPEPSDCSVYYLCGGGVPYSRTCPTGTLYSPACKCCDWANNVQCATGNARSIAGDKSIAITNAHAGPHSASAENFCPNPNGMFPDLTDCGAYYLCAGGVPFLYTCPAGTLFSTTLQNCDWEANVECTSDVAARTVTQALLYVYSGLCPDADGIYPVPSDCGSYYRCSWGMPHFFSCPPGTLYSTSCTCCDWAHNVQCLL